MLKLCYKHSVTIISPIGQVKNQGGIAMAMPHKRLRRKDGYEGPLIAGAPKKNIRMEYYIYQM